MRNISTTGAARPTGSATDLLTALPAAELTRLLAHRLISAREVMEAHLHRIAERDDLVHAWSRVDPEAALRAAERRDAICPTGPLHGLPIAVKDLIDTIDLPTEYGSPLYDGHRPRADAAIVAALRRAGAVVAGKTVTSEFGLFGAGPTRNPHDLSRTPGASSSGSAAAVADLMIPIALGTQTAGSIIRPSAYCGVVGHKPSFGSWDRRGIKLLSRSFDTPGVIGRTVDDIRLIAEVLAPPVTAPAVPGELRFKAVKPGAWDRAEPASREALVLARRVADVEALTELPGPLRDAEASCETIIWAELARALAPEARHDATIARTLAEHDASPEAIAVAVACLRQARSSLPAVFADCDAVITVATTGEAPPLAAGTGDPIFCRLWSGLGCPAVSLPVGIGPAGLPLAVQVLAAPGADATVLTAAANLQERLPAPTVPAASRHRDQGT